MNLRQKAIMFLATGCLSGRIPFAPGTFGSMLGLPVCFVLAGLKAGTALPIICVFIGFAVFISHHAEKIVQKKDPGCIVIDEIAGMLVTLFAVPVNLISFGAGFLIFRALDITKPFPIRRLERWIPGGAGIVADDLAAGIFGNLLLRTFLHALGTIGGR